MLRLRQFSKTVGIAGVGVERRGIAEVDTFVDAKLRDVVYLLLGFLFRETILLGKAVNGDGLNRLGRVGVKLESTCLDFHLILQSKFLDGFLQTGLADVAVRASIVTPINDFHCLNLLYFIDGYYLFCFQGIN